MERNKAAIMASGIDPEMKKLRKLHSIAARKKKMYVAALEAVEDYWDNVFDAIDKKKGAA